MEIISFYKNDRQQHWLEEIGKSDWKAGQYLHEILSKGTFYDLTGENSELLLLTDGDHLVSFCTYAERDEVASNEYSPWIGFVYTYPKYRGHRYMGLLFEKIEHLAKEQNIPDIYISTDHIGLYEKYGFEYIKDMETIYGDISRVYLKHIR
ncbi:GNAT family N-acetyltransferase [Ruminococcus albus]|uniref:Acetyltransferase (GNAT) domain-containing protein n=1 Tax=Ruminococcus albus TaxID=1264 RepID=A0A1I1N9X9_RUMAL|nr:GNAT family N-acetyltransferase [Ruminococcus albus]SFC94544.1 Acetyltransferase (GNAT) domain-containing protein [Ruminococcus albus]